MILTDFNYFRSETRWCRRAKRQRCRAALSAAHPLHAPERVAEMCRARKWLRRCVRKAVRRAALPSHLAGGAPGHGKRLKAEWTGRCGARLEKRVRKVRAERRNKLVKSGECISAYHDS